MKAVGGWEKLGLGNRDPLTNAIQNPERVNLSPWTRTNLAAKLVSGVNHFAPEDNSYYASVVEDPGTHTNAFVQQIITGAAGTEKTVSVVVERHQGFTFDNFSFTFYHDSTTMVRTTLTWADLSVAVIKPNSVPASASVNDMGVGPCGGILARVILTVTIPDSGTQALRIYPTGDAAATIGTIMIHHTQVVEGDTAGGVNFETGEVQQGRIQVDAPISGGITWKDNEGISRAVVGTLAQVWTYAENVILQITPAGFLGGNNSATTVKSTYGDGGYGVGGYGTGDLVVARTSEAQSWQFDTWGEYLISVALSDGKLYEWQLGSDEVLTQVTNAPADNVGMVVTSERFIFLLGAGGDSRKIQWCDQEDNTDWTPTATNQAGDFFLPGNGGLLCGRRGRGETLLWTTSSLFSAQFIGGTLVYSFLLVGENCGAISRRAVVLADGGSAFWMGNNSFFRYDGSVIPIPCTVQDYVFSDLNIEQVSLIHAVQYVEANEVTWYYPSKKSAHIDRYVTYNYLDNIWYTGRGVNRTAGIDRGVFNFPILCDQFGVAYFHETGSERFTFLGEELIPTAKTGPIELDKGENVFFLRRFVPDDGTEGGVDITIQTRLYPEDPTFQEETFTPTRPTDMRMTGRQVSLRIEETSPGWRFGIPRLDVEAGGYR